MKRWPLYYPGYHGLNELKDIPLDKKFTVRFSAPIAWESVTGETIELIESESGTRVPLEFEPLSDREVRVIPQDLLEPGKTYWLLMHRGIRGKNGAALREGAIALARTVDAEGNAVSMGTATGKVRIQSDVKIQSDYEGEKRSFSLKSIREIYGVPDFMPPLNEKDYGQTLVK